MSGAVWQTWITPDGAIQAPIPIHVKIIYGVSGEPGAPQAFYAWDPIYGKITYAPRTLSGIMFGQVVVVY